MPLTAIISDVLGSLDALRCALADADAKGCARVVCLGNLVKPDAKNEEVIEEIARRGVVALQGPIDERNDAVLSRRAFEFLEGLPKSLVEGKTHFAHASPRGTARTLLSPYEAWNVFDEFRHRMIFVGQLGRLLLYGEKNEDKFSARRHKVELNTPYALEWNDRYIVSVGSVAGLRDGVMRVRYAIYDDEEHAVEFRAINEPIPDGPTADIIDFSSPP